MSYTSNILRFNTDEIIDGSRLEWWWGNLPLINAPVAGENFDDWYFYMPEVESHNITKITVTMTIDNEEETFTIDDLSTNGGRYHITVGIPDANTEVIVEAKIKLGNSTYYTVYSFIPNRYYTFPLYLTNAYNFTDEENAEITYGYEETPYRWETILGILKPGINPASEFPYFDDLSENCLLYTELDIREDTSGTEIYEWGFYDDERELLRNTYNTATTNTLWFTTLERYENDDYDYEVSINGGDFEEAWGENYNISYIDTNFTIVNCKPTIVDPTVKDIKPETLALTGNEDRIVLNASMVEYSFDGVASKGATIVDCWVSCGTKEIHGLYNGVMDEPDDTNFMFWIKDSRGLIRGESIAVGSYIHYFKPTCYQTLEIELSEEKTAKVTIDVEGNYFNGHFGKASNTLLLEVRYGEKNGTMGAWTPISGTPTLEEDKYSLTTSIDGFNYEKAYVFQCRATDKLNYVISAQYTIRLLPVYDWSEEDFNLNVPLKINGETVLRHNEEANNTVLSASGGHIYIRPAGTDNTTGETIIYPDGSIKFGGAIGFNGAVDFGENAEIGSEVSFTNKVDFSNTVNFDSLKNITFGGEDGLKITDIVIESGSASMGSNGTWFWRKWASGTAECFGVRNFGRMAVTTAWGNLYRSAVQTQSLPSGLFSETPEVININMINSDYGGWICKHENTAPSKDTTGSFIYVRPASATTTSSYIGFHVIGSWI